MKSQSSYEILTQAWRGKHFEHLVFCLENDILYYEGTFRYGGVDDEGFIVVNGQCIFVAEIIYTIAIYYEDNIKNYQTPFRDFIYLCFTELVTDDVDILEELEA